MAATSAATDPGAPAAMTAPAPRRAVVSWALYDMANTVFSLAVVSLHFPLYLKERFGLPDTAFAVTNSASVALMLLLSPLVGRVSDLRARRVPLLALATLVCVLATATLGFLGWQVALVAFGVANVAFLSGLVLYDALLPEVSTSANRGRVGAWGVAVGYAGSFLGLAVGELLLPRTGRAGVFAASAALFLLLALPCFLWVRERPRPHQPIRLRGLLAGTLRAFADVMRGRDGTAVGRFLAARLFYSDAVNTMILFMGTYVTYELGFASGQATLTLAIGIAGAMLGAPLWGMLADRRGPRRALGHVLVAWMLGLAATAALPVLHGPSSWFLPIAAWLGACLGGTWACDRALLLALAPAQRVGEYYGYYGMAGRFSAVAGPLLWALVVDGLGWGRPAAVATLLVAVVVAAVLLLRVPAASARPSAA